jgi:hypothetical protein
MMVDAIALEESPFADSGVGPMVVNVPVIMIQVTGERRENGATEVENIGP